MEFNNSETEQLSKKRDIFKFKIDGKMYEVATPCMIGCELLKLAGKSCDTHELRMKTAGNIMVKIECDQSVDLRHPGLEKFVTLPLEQQEGEDVETFKGHGPKIKIKIDGKIYEVDCTSMTGKELLELAGKNPYTKYGISKRMKGNELIPVGYEEEVNLSEPGLEKFITLPYEQTEGEGLERAFLFNEEDTFFLDKQGVPYETIKEGMAHWLLIHDFPIPEGYNIDKATAAISVPGGYPDTSLDMVYFYPPLSLNNGKAIPATNCMVRIRGKQYQRWSRHFTTQNPWRAGIDNLNTFWLYIQNWLKKELTR